MPEKLYKILLILGIAFFILAIPLFWLSYPRLEGFWNQSKAIGELEVDFLNVGQGDSILIKTPMGQNIIIDGGPENIIEELGASLPWWDKTIDLMVLTHPHDDHVIGLIEVLKRYKVKKVIYTGVVHSSPGYITWLELIRNNKIPLTIIDRPQVINLGDDCEFDIIYPFESLLGKEVANLNNSSLVVKLTYKETSFLFSGDTEKEVEDLILAKEDIEYLKADVLKVAHHGSDTSSGEEFIQAVNPDIAVIEVGIDNTFGHPSRRILKRLERDNVKILRTDTAGTIKLKSNGEIVYIL